MTGYIAALFSVSILIPTVSTAQSPQTSKDVQCALASNLVASGAKNDQHRQIARDMVHFYLGRIDGRLNEAQLKIEIAAQKKVITKANINGTMQSCLAVAQRRLKAIQAVAR